MIQIEVWDVKGTPNETVIRKVDTDCERCKRRDAYDVPHFNCMYNGQRSGHSAAHCTANACY